MIGTGRAEKDEQIWLVKSGDRILGPYTKEEIKNRLMDREIVVIDEITTPTKRWRYIRDEPAFALIVEEIRKAHLNSREDTELGTVSKTVEEFGERTSDFEATSASFHQTSNIKDAEIVGETNAIPHPAKPSGTPPPIRSYGTASDQRVKEEVSRSGRMLWLSTFIVLAVAVFMFVRLQTPKTTVVEGNSGELVAAAVKARALGDFRRAITIYEQLRAKKKTQPGLLVDLAVLRLKVGDQSTPSDRILDSVAQKKLTSSGKAKYHTARGLIALINNNNLSHARAEFEKALEADRSFAAAAFNKAMVDFADPSFNFADLAKANKLANEFIRVSEMPTLDISGRNAAKVLAAIVRLKNREGSLAKQSKDYLDILLKNVVQYWQEASFLRAYARYLSGQGPQAARDLRITLGADPFVTNEHVNDPYLYIAPLNWQTLKPMCEEMYNELSDRAGKKDSTVEAMFHFCRFKAGDDQGAAREAIKNLEARSVSDPLVRSIAAYMIMGISPDQAKAKVSDAADGVSWDLGRIIRGRLCARDDFACLHSTFRETAMMPTAVYFYVGAAKYFRAQGDPAQAMLANDTIASVERKSPNYIPLLEYKAEEGR